jgi:hypothetical protein
MRRYALVEYPKVDGSHGRDHTGVFKDCRAD